MSRCSPKVVLCFPPQFEPFQPYLAGAHLIASLNLQGIPAHYLDLNLAYYESLLGTHAASLRGEGVESPLSYDDYKVIMDRATRELARNQHHIVGINFYGSTFGDRLFSAEGLLELVRSGWAGGFERFLGAYLCNHLTDIEEAELVGVILVVHDQLPAAMLVTEAIKRINKRAKVCWGGPLISRIGKSILKEPLLSNFFDYLILGAGEIALPMLARAVSTNEESRIQGLAYSRQRECESLTLAPQPRDYQLPDFSTYEIDSYLSPYRILPYLTSRGCYWGKCEFCCHYLPFAQYGHQQVGEVIKQLKKLALEHGVKFFSFSDEAIPCSILRALSRTIIEEHLDIRWFTFARLEPGFDYATCALLKRAGCRILMFGFETAVQRVSDLMRKGTKVGDVRKILLACREAGISVRLDTLIGFPTETAEESEQTLTFLLENRELIDTPFSVTPLSKFELYVDAPMGHRLGDYGVHIGEPLRGPLDYQHAYTVSSGMGPRQVDDQYEKYILTISKEFRSHARMPENKTHAFLMKCHYSDMGIENELFSDEIQPHALREYFFRGFDAMDISPVSEDSIRIRNPQNGAEIRVTAGLLKELNAIAECGQVSESLLSRYEDCKVVAAALTYMSRFGFLKAHQIVSSMGLKRV